MSQRVSVSVGARFRQTASVKNRLPLLPTDSSCSEKHRVNVGAENGLERFDSLKVFPNQKHVFIFWSILLAFQQIQIKPRKDKQTNKKKNIGHQ